uniref:Uncharacterized protein n=1 Tax=Arundo donax TaxID=35708 RepID=A0A0A9GXR8_ARUDO
MLRLLLWKCSKLRKPHLNALNDVVNRFSRVNERMFRVQTSYEFICSPVQTSVEDGTT